MWTGNGASLLHSAWLLGTTAQALAFWSPRQTAGVVVPPDAQSPRPTIPPAIHKLLRRQSSAKEYTYSVGPDNTCGFISGLPGAPYTCEISGATCIFFASSTNLPGAVACCDNDCTVRLACLDFDDISSSSRCDDQCLVDTFTTKCTDSSRRFCNTLSFSGGVSEYFCDSVTISSVQAATTTYRGETDGRSFSKFVITDTDETVGVSLPTKSATPPSSSPTVASGTTSSTPVPTSTSGGNGDGHGDSGGGGSSTPVGPIVGGVVGGLAVVGLVILGVIFLLRKKGGDQPAAQPAPPGGFPPMQQQPVASSPNSHMSFYGGALDPSKFVGQPVVQTYPEPRQQQIQQLNSVPYEASATPIQQQNSVPYEASASPIQQQPPQQFPLQQAYYPGPTSPQVQQDPAVSPSQSDHQRLSQQSFTTVQSQPTQQQPQIPPTVHETGSNTGYWAAAPGQQAQP